MTPSSVPAPAVMTAATFRALREFLGLPGSWCAGHFGVAARTVRKWDQGEAPVPAGVARELARLVEMTREYVERTAQQLRADPAGSWPFEIPRTTADLEAWTPATDLPLDWWRNVGARLIDAVPGLWLDWPSSAADDLP